MSSIPPMPEEDVAEALQMAADGYTRPEIREWLGCTVGQLTLALGTYKNPKISRSTVRLRASDLDARP